MSKSFLKTWKTLALMTVLTSLIVSSLPLRPAVGQGADDPLIPNLELVCPDAPDPAFPWRCVGSPGISKVLNLMLTGPVIDFVGVQAQISWLSIGSQTCSQALQVTGVSVNAIFKDEPFDFARIEINNVPCYVDIALSTQTPISLSDASQISLADVTFRVGSAEIGLIGTPNIELIAHTNENCGKSDSVQLHGRRWSNDKEDASCLPLPPDGPGSPGSRDKSTGLMKVHEKGGSPKLVALLTPSSAFPEPIFYETENAGIGTVPPPDARLLNFKVRVLDKRIDLSQGETSTDFTARVTNLADFPVFVRARYIVTGTTGTVILCNAPDLNKNCLIDKDDNFLLGPKGSATDTVDIVITITPPAFPDNYKSVGILEASSIIVVAGAPTPVGFITIERTTAATNFRVQA